MEYESNKFYQACSLILTLRPQQQVLLIQVYHE